MKKSKQHIQYIIPPYIAERIIENGTDKQKEKAREYLKIAGQFRGQRQALADLTKKAMAAAGTRNRLVYDVENGTTLPGTLKRREGDPPTSDNAVDEAYDGLGATYDLYSEIYSRSSIDNQGMDLVASVHFGDSYDNAFWNGDQMVFGDGDEDLPEAQRIFNRFTKAIDIIGHELTHGVTQHEAQLIYQYQSGAMNESFSDVFGSLVKQRALNQTADTADWIIGEGLFSNNINAIGIRSMKAPGTAYDDPLIGKDPQPGHMNDYVNTSQDQGGVHINSGIPNKAFYIAATELGGNAWDKAGKIWYKTLCDDRLSQTSNFLDTAKLTCTIAAEEYGNNSAEYAAVKKGWEDVGVLPGDNDEPGCPLWFLNIFRSIFGRRRSK